MQENIELDDSQIAWYVKKKETQGDDMMREYPATADEAFRQSVEGSYFAKQFLYIESDQKLDIKINGSIVTNQLNTFSAGTDIRPGVFMSSGSIKSAEIVNTSQLTANIFYATAE